MNQKHCSSCKELKGISYFSRYPDKRLHFGYAYRSQCKDCFNILYNKSTNPRPRDGKPRGMKEARKRYWEKNPEKLKAQKKVQAAVRTGKLARDPCVVCGERKVHGHHPNYSKPLEVIWLCAAHHKKVHVGSIKLLNYTIKKYD